MWVMTEIRQELKAILEIQKETATKVDELYHRIFVSNGKPSLVATVESLDERVDKLEQAVGLEKQNRIELWHGILLALVSVALGSVAGAGWQYQRDLPSLSTPTEEVQGK